MAGATEEVKIVLSAEERASREIDRLQRKLTEFQGRMKRAFATPIGNAFFDDKKVTAAFAKYGKGMKEVTESHIRWAHDQRRMGKLTEEAWYNQTRAVKAFLGARGAVAKADRAAFVEQMQRARAMQIVWNRGHERYVQQKRREQTIMDQVERAKERLAGLGFTNEVRRRRVLDSLDRQRSRAYLASEREKETARRSLERQRSRAFIAQIREEERLGNRATAARLREELRAQRIQESARRSLEAQRSRAFLAEERRKQALRINSWRLQMRQDEAARRQQERAEKASRRYRSRKMGAAGGNARDAFMGGAMAISIAGGIVAAAVTKIAETGLSARMRTDSAEANLRMFGGLSEMQVQQARTGWLDRAAIEKGFRPSSAINAYTEVLKAGIPMEAAPSVTKSIMGGAAGLDLNVADTTKLVGRLATLTQDPKKFDGGAIDKMLNGIAVVAKVTAADSNELVSSLRRGAGVLGSTKMSVEDLTAFTGIGISAGMQEGKAGTFMDFLSNELVNAKNSRGQRRMDLARGAQLAGLGSLNQVSRQAANDPTTLLLKLFERMAKMNPEKAGQVATLIGMREWRGEMLQMMKASPMLRQTVEAGRDPKNANHLQQAQDIRLGTIRGMISQITATADLLWEAIGKGLEEPFREIGRFFIEFGKNVNGEAIQASVKSLIDGIVDGLGFNNLSQVFEAIFGKPGQFDFSMVDKFFRFGRGLGQGIREIVDVIRNLIPAGGVDAESIGLWTSRITGLATAFTMARPALDVISSLASMITSLGLALIGAQAGLSILGMVLGGGAGAAAGGAGVAAGAGIASFMVAGALPVVLAAASIAAIAALFGREATKGAFIGIPSGDSTKTKEEILGGELGAIAPLGRRGARIEKQSYGGDSPLAGLIQKASYDAFSDGDRGVNRIAENIRDLKTLIQLAHMTGSGVGASLSAAAGSAASGLGGGGTSGLTGSFKPQGMTVPGWYGASRGAVGGSASSNPANSAASARMLDAIAGTESGKAGYDAVLGNGRYGTPSKPVSQMTLDEAFAFGRQIKARHGSSSALGRYQIVGNTMRAAQRALGIPGNATFDQAMQDRMARWIARSQGLGAWEGLKHNPRAMAAARAAMAEGGAKDAPGGMNVPSIAGSVPDITGALGSTKGLRIKSGEALAGGATNPAIIAAAQMIQSGNIAGGLNRFTAFNDLYHKSTGSKHASGLAGDFTLKDASQSGAAAEQVRRMFRSAGLSDNDFRVIDEYKNPSRRSTGGHIHYQINSAIAAAKYAQALQAKAAATANSLNETADVAKRAYGAGPAKPPAEKMKSIGDGFSSTGWQKPTTDEIVGRQPAGIGGRGGGGGGGGRGGNTVHITQNIHGGNQSPSEIANLSQRKITTDWNHRSHDLEPELT